MIDIFVQYLLVHPVSYFYFFIILIVRSGYFVIKMAWCPTSGDRMINLIWLHTVLKPLNYEMNMLSTSHNHLKNINTQTHVI